MGLIKRLRDLKNRITGNKDEETVEYRSLSTDVAVTDEIILSGCRELALYTGATDKDIGIEAEMRKLRKELDKEKDRIEEANRGIDQMEHELNIRYAPSVRELNTLQQELATLFAAKSKKQNSGDNCGGIDDDGDEDDSIKEVELTAEDYLEIEAVRQRMEGHPDQEAAVKNAERVIKSNRKLGAGRKKKSKRAKDLWFKITKRTHPDKTSDPKLNELFRQGKIAYENHDVDMLQEIYDHLITKGSSLLRSLMARLEELKEELREKRLSFAELRRSQEYAMWIDYCVPEHRSSVESMFLKDLNAEIRKTIEMIRFLDPTRHVPKPAESFNMFKTGTTTVMGESITDELDSPWGDEDETD